MLLNGDVENGFVDIMDVSAAPVEHRFRLWRDLLRSGCGPLTVTRDLEDEPFAGRIVQGQFGAMCASLVDAQAYTVSREACQIARTGDGNIYVCVVFEGEADLAQDGRTATARTGELIAWDSSRPFRLRLPGPIKMVTAKFPHRQMGLSPQDTRHLTAAVWPGGQGIGRLLQGVLDSFSSRMTEFSADTAGRLGDSIRLLVEAMFAERLADATASSAEARQALLLRIQAYARRYLGDPALSPRLLADRHRISLRHLQVLFQEQNVSPARWIRDERLSRCYEDLCSPSFDHLTVAGLGERWGLVGASHFSRLFRERYHVTPREVRRRRMARV